MDSLDTAPHAHEDTAPLGTGPARRGRRCLRCGRAFRPQSRFNRVCSPCKCDDVFKSRMIVWNRHEGVTYSMESDRRRRYPFMFGDKG
jgi:hypothetical protein